MDNVSIIIMAGGLGKRMNSNVPKVLHKIGGIPMVCSVLKQAKMISSDIIIVVGAFKEAIEESINKYSDMNNVRFVIQEQPLGTGHAVLCCLQKMELRENILVLSGDIPLMKAETMKNMLDFHINGKKIGVTIAICDLDDQRGYGRIYTNENKFIKIIEEKDCSDKMKEIKTVNCGIYVFNNINLRQYLHRVGKNNVQCEYYLTDVVALIQENENNVQMFMIPKEKQIEIMGVNTTEQLNVLESMYIESSDNPS